MDTYKNMLIWWESLSFDKQKEYLLKHDPNIINSNMNELAVYRLINNDIIYEVFNKFYIPSESKIETNADVMSYIGELFKDVSIERRYDYITCMLLTIPITIDDLSTILKILVKTKNN